MNSKPSDNFDWSWIRVFLQVAEHGSVSAAAQHSGQSQPTISRQIKALEQSLGVHLFDRTSQGLVLAPAGVNLLDHGAGHVGRRPSLYAQRQRSGRYHRRNHPPDGE